MTKLQIKLKIILDDTLTFTSCVKGLDKNKDAVSSRQIYSFILK